MSSSNTHLSTELFGYRPSIALYQPENPENVGLIIRLCDCFDFDLQVIEPIGFCFESPHVQRKKLDYCTQIIRHADFATFLQYNENKRIVLFTPHTSLNVSEINLSRNDVLLFGRESCGVPNEIAMQCDVLVQFTISPRARSLNLAMSAAIGMYAFSICNII